MLEINHSQFCVSNFRTLGKLNLLNSIEKEDILIRIHKNHTHAHNIMKNIINLLLNLNWIPTKQMLTVTWKFQVTINVLFNLEIRAYGTHHLITQKNIKI